jgi:hypothetical protein
MIGGTLMSQPSVKDDTSLEVDLESPIICDANWVDREDDTSVHCENVAEYSAIGHDELHSHKCHQLVLCQDCITLLTIPQPAKCQECGDVLIYNIVPL